MPHAQRVALAVDDEPSDLEAVRKILENAGYAVLTAADGKTALDKFQPNAESVGLLVTDVAMSPMDGCELASRLVQLKPSLRVVFVSAYSGAVAIRYRGQPLSDFVFVSKPFSAEELMSKGCRCRR